MQKSIGFAIVGPGLIAQVHREAIAANADLGAHLVAVGHYNPARFAEISAEFGVPCLSLAEVLAHPEVDVVLISSPSGHHASQTIAAARAGKHVLVEKPMALSLADADAMISACEKANVKLGVVFQGRTRPVQRRIQKTIRNGGLGRLLAGSLTMVIPRPQAYYDMASWRGTWALDGGGVMTMQGIHFLDMLSWYLGDPVEVRAFAGTLAREIEVEDSAVAILRYADGSLFTITATTACEPAARIQYEIYGTTGAIQMEGEKIIRWQTANPDQDTLPVVADDPQPEPTVSVNVLGKPITMPLTPFATLVRDFIQAIDENRDPLISGKEGRRSLATLVAIYEAAGIGAKQHVSNGKAQSSDKQIQQGR
ncbi:MAG: Gfo/Idh/MocA family oxidoreductase [Chloroflexi bacterium]|nr:Gfo/Idh/MocA family oxidoreductase [Chloroflexota bacterium]